MQCLLDVLDDSPAEAPITNMAAEALACLAVGDAASRVRRVPPGWSNATCRLMCLSPYVLGGLMAQDKTKHAWKVFPVFVALTACSTRQTL